MKFHEWGVGVDPDESCWVESVKFNLSFLVVIRVFYELGPPACEEIGQLLQPPINGCPPLWLSDRDMPVFNMTRLVLSYRPHYASCPL